MGLCLLLSNPLTAQNKYYYAYDNQVVLQANAGKYVISYKEGQKSSIQQYLTSNNLGLTTWNEFGNYCIIGSTLSMQQFKTLFKSNNNIRAIQPLYKTTNGMEMIITDEIVVKFKNHISQSIIKQYFNSLNVMIKKTTEQFYIVAVAPNTDALEIANTIQKSGLAIFSHPDFIAKTEKHQIPNDPYFVNQFYLRNTGQIMTNGHSGISGADINILDKLG